MEVQPPLEVEPPKIAVSIVFFGTSEFAVPILEKLDGAGFRPILVVTTPDAPAGRKKVLTPPPIKVKAQELGLEIYQPESLKANEAIERIKQIEPTVGVMAAYGKLISKAVIDLFPKGILNIHPSLLPRWRGPTPIQSAILAGDEKTGVTVMLVDDEMDHGPILAQRELKIKEVRQIDYVTLSKILAEMGAELLVETLPKWLSHAITPLPQDHAKATICRKFTLEDAKIDWSKSAGEIDRLVRALNPEPGTWTQWQRANGPASTRRRGEAGKWQILKILAIMTSLHSQVYKDVIAGIVFEYENKLVVRCGEGALILEIVRPAGKKTMSGEDFLRGHREIVGTVLQ